MLRTTGFISILCLLIFSPFNAALAGDLCPYEAYFSEFLIHLKSRDNEEIAKAQDESDFQQFMTPELYYYTDTEYVDVYEDNWTSYSDFIYGHDYKLFNTSDGRIDCGKTVRGSWLFTYVPPSYENELSEDFFEWEWGKKYIACEFSEIGDRLLLTRHFCYGGTEGPKFYQNDFPRDWLDKFKK